MTTTKMDIDIFVDWNALFIAIANRKAIEILHYLQRNPDLGFTDQNGDTALHMLFHKDPYLDHQPDIVKLMKILFDYGANPNAVNNQGRTPLHLAIKYRMNDVIDFLIAQGAILNICDKDGDSTAHFLVDSEFDNYCATCWSTYYTVERQQSAQKEGISFISWLASKGLNFNYRNNDGLTPAHLAAKFNFQHVLLELLKHTNNLCINHVTIHNQNIFHILIDSFKRDVCLGLKNEKKPMTIPFDYDKSYMTSIIKSLLSKQFPVDATDNNGNTALHLVAKKSWADMMDLLLDNFTKIDAQDSDGNTLLHIVLLNSRKPSMIDHREKIIRTLMSKRSNIHIKNNSDLVPLQIAVLHHNEAMVRLLMRHGAKFDVIHVNGNLLHFLVWNPNPPLNQYFSYSIVDLLVSQGCDVNEINRLGSTPIHLALKSCNSWIVDRLIHHGADLRMRQLDESKFTTLHLAVKYGYERYFIDKIIDVGVDVNAEDASGRTPLHLAASSGSKLLPILLDRGAYVDTYDRAGYLPLHLALRNENVDGVRRLIQYGADINNRHTMQEIGMVMYSKNIVKEVLNHWLKLKTAGLLAIKEFAYCLDEYCRVNGSWYRQKIQVLEKMCEAEIEYLKTRKIDGHVSWYNFLHMDLNRRCAFVRDNENLARRINEASFPLYERVIFGAFHQAVARMPLIRDAVSSWYRLTNYYIPDMCVEMIFSNLSNADLRDIIESVKYVEKIPSLGQKFLE